MDVAGKTVAFLGDSITEGAGASCVENRFTDVFARLTGGVALNYGMGGTKIARQKGETCYEQDFNRRVAEMDPSADIVVVFGGTNDFGHGDAPLGQFTDNTVYTFYGALHVLFKQLIEKYWEKDIIVMTPLHRLSENVTVNEIGLPCEPLKKYVEAIREVAEYYSLPVLDLWKMSGIQPSVDVMREKYMPDGLHPNDRGAAKIADKLRDFLIAL